MCDNNRMTDSTQVMGDLLAPCLNRVHEKLGLVFRGGSIDAVSEVHNVVAAAALCQDRLRLLLDGGVWSMQNERVQVALDSNRIADAFPCLGNSDSPIQTDDITSSSCRKRDKGDRIRVRMG